MAPVVADEDGDALALCLLDQLERRGDIVGNGLLDEDRDAPRDARQAGWLGTATITPSGFALSKSSSALA